MPYHAPNDGVHIRKIMDSTECMTHDAPTGIPCYHIRLTDHGEITPGVCGQRIKKAGYVGQISEASMNDKPSRPRRDSHSFRSQKFSK